MWLGSETGAWLPSLTARPFVFVLDMNADLRLPLTNVAWAGIQ